MIHRLVLLLHYLDLPIVYFDTGGIGSDKSSLEQRREQFQAIKRELLPEPAVKDIERLLAASDEFSFVMRIPPLRWAYSFFKWLNKIK